MAQALARGVVRARLLIWVAAAFRGMPAGDGVILLPDIPDRQCRDGPPQRLFRGKQPVVAMPVLPRRRHEVGKSVEELKRREFDDAARPRPSGPSAAAGPDRVGSFVPGKHVADASDLAVCTTRHGESLDRKRRPGTVPQECSRLWK